MTTSWGPGGGEPVVPVPTKRDAEQVVRAMKAELWDEGFEAAENMARNWGHLDYWEDWPTNPYREAS